MHNCGFVEEEGRIQSSTCRNTEGGWSCDCSGGFEKRLTTTGLAVCVDKNECANTVVACGRASTCKNTIGSFECGCIDGFEMSSDGCVDIGKLRLQLRDSQGHDSDECEQTPSPCENNTCYNIPGTYICVPKP